MAYRKKRKILFVILYILFPYLLSAQRNPEVIEQWLNGNDLIMKEIAIKDIGKYKYKKFIPQLIKILDVDKVEDKEKVKRKVDEKDESKLRAAAALALGEFKEESKEIIPILISRIEKDKFKRVVRIACIKSLGNIGRNDEIVLFTLIKLLDEFDPELVIEAIISLEKIGDNRVQYILADVVRVYEDIDVRKKALETITKIGNKKVINELKSAIEVNKNDETYKEIVPFIEKTIAQLSKKN
jgi:HEAT repeat protein